MPNLTEIIDNLNQVKQDVSEMLLRAKQGAGFAVKQAELTYVELDSNVERSGRGIQETIDNIIDSLGIVDEVQQNAGASGEVLITNSFTYNPQLHRNKRLIVDTTAGQVNVTLPDNLTEFDVFLLIHKSGANNVKFVVSAPSGVIEEYTNFNEVDVLLPTDEDGQRSRVWMFKNKDTDNFGAYGKGLSVEGQFEQAPGFARIVNATPTGGEFEDRYTLDCTVWYMGKLASDPAPADANEIKSQTGAVFGGTSLNALADTLLTDSFSGASAGVAYTIYVLAESVAESLISTFAWTAPAASAGIQFGSYATYKAGDAGFNFDDSGANTIVTIPHNLVMPANSLCFIFYSFRGSGAINSVSCTLGGEALSKLSGLKTPATYSQYLDVYMITKADAPGEGVNNIVLTGPNYKNDTSVLVNVLIVENAQQVYLPLGQIETLETNSPSYPEQLLFSGLPSDYMLVNYAVTRDSDDSTLMSVPGDQNILHQGIDQEIANSVASYKIGTGPNDDMEADEGDENRLVHFAMQINAV